MRGMRFTEFTEARSGCPEGATDRRLEQRGGRVERASSPSPPLREERAGERRVSRRQRGIPLLNVTLAGIFGPSGVFNSTAVFLPPRGWDAEAQSGFARALRTTPPPARASALPIAHRAARTPRTPKRTG